MKMNKNTVRKLMRIELAKAELIAKYIYILKLRQAEKRCARKTLKKRRVKGDFHTLVPKMRLNDTESFINFHRMDPDTFEELLHLVGPYLRYIPRRAAEEVTAAESLALTLRYLASGESMKSVGFYNFRIGANTASGIIRETCQIIWEKLKFVFPPPSVAMWNKVVNKFYEKLRFPNCLGAIDGKNVIFQTVANHNYLPVNYRNSHSLILLAVANADYKFIFVDVDSIERNSDAGAFRRAKFGRFILEKSDELHAPAERCLPVTNEMMPCVFVGNESFPLRTNILRPYSGHSTGYVPTIQSTLNASLARARRVIDNSFWILENRWRIYRKPIVANQESVAKIVRATLCLHNWLTDKPPSRYITEDLLGELNGIGAITSRTCEQNALQPIGRVGSNNASQAATDIRDKYADHFYNCYKAEVQP